MDATPLPLLRLRPGDIEIDNARNLSRAGLVHDPAAVREMAELLLAHGQLSPVEVVAPADWTPEDWALCVSEHGVGPVPCGEFVDQVCPRGRLNFGFRRHLAASLLVAEGKTSPRWDGYLLARVAPAGLSDEELEDRNLCENLGGLGVAYVDLGLAAHRLTAEPKDGGRGEEHMIAASRLNVPIAELKRLLLLPALCDEARALSRLHHHDKERGITPIQALKLARRPVEEQATIIAAAKDGAHQITPKGMRAAIAPHQGRQGQPPGATGAQLTRGAGLFGRLAATEDPTLRYGLSRETAALVHSVLLALVDLDTAALQRLPQGLGKRLQAAIMREPER